MQLSADVAISTDGSVSSFTTRRRLVLVAAFALPVGEHGRRSTGGGGGRRIRRREGRGRGTVGGGQRGDADLGPMAAGKTEGTWWRAGPPPSLGPARRSGGPVWGRRIRRGEAGGVGGRGAGDGSGGHHAGEEIPARWGRKREARVGERGGAGQ